MVPAIAIGFADLQKRTEVQTRVAGAHYAKLQEISARLAALSKSSHMSLSLRLSRAELLETQLSHRTLQLIKHLHLLIPTLRSSSIRRDEEVLTQRLEALVGQLEGGRGRKGESLKGRMVELWGLLGEVKSERDRDRSAAGGREGWAIVDENAMNELATVRRLPTLLAPAKDCQGSRSRP
jgi:nuclear pore complex protein Nup54